MISTRHLETLPDLDTFVRRAQALATLDAILSPDWEFRIYSFNAAWGDGLQMASMRDGEGNHWFAVIGEAGIALHGLAHESPTFTPGTPRPVVFADLPAAFHATLLREPAFETQHSTFCLWRLRTDAAWHSGPALQGDDTADGSEELLVHLDGDPATYVAFAADYYERELDLADVAALYAHQPLTDELVRRLNPDADLEALQADLTEIGYPGG